jgi:adenylate cyclase class 2
LRKGRYVHLDLHNLLWTTFARLIHILDLDKQNTAKRTLIEIKARCARGPEIHEELLKLGADFKGTDNQTDTYFKIEQGGRLKLRRGNIENSLIQYHRANDAAPKQSNVNLHRPADLEETNTLEAVLRASHSILVEVKKNRQIYFIDNVKFHLDTVEGLGTFMEIEAIDSDGSKSVESLHAQCLKYISHFEIKDEDLLTHSYSDMLLELNRA